MIIRRSAFVCVLFAVGAQFASGCGGYCCNRPFLCRPLFSGCCWPHCYGSGASYPAASNYSSGAAYPVGDAAPMNPGCSSCMASPAGSAISPGIVYGAPSIPSGPSVQVYPGMTQAPMPAGMVTPTK